MQEEIRQEYEKIKDILSEDEFLAELEEVKEQNAVLPFLDEIDAAREVLKNHGIDPLGMTVENDDEQFEVTSDDESNEIVIEMTEEVREVYDKVQNQISEDEFLSRMEAFKQSEKDNPFMTLKGLADMVAGELITEEPEVLTENADEEFKPIKDLEDKSRDVTVTGRVISISNPRSFKTRKGQDGKVCNVELKDNTGEIRTVFWTPNMKLLKNFKEGDIIQIKNVDIKEGFSGLEANLRPRSSVVRMDEDPSRFPVYEETITKIADIQPDTKVNIIARIVRIPTIRSYEKNGKEGKVASLELKDDSGQISYTLWNKNVDLIESLGLEDGDTVKILQAQARERPNRDGEYEITLTHWDGRIIKGDFEAPEVEQEFSLIGDLTEQKDVSIKGIVSRLQDVRIFTRKSDNTEGKLRNFDVRDSTGEIRVTVWGDDTALNINKGDSIKVMGGEVRFDDYTQSGYSMNTNFNTQISINPTNLSVEDFEEFEQLRSELRPTPVGEIFQIDEDGIEIDVIGRILSLNDPREFQRDTGEVGVVRSALFADESGKVRLSFWNEKAEGAYAVGEAYRIENARTRAGMYSVDLNIGRGSRIIRLSEEEASAMFIPELATLEKAIYDYISIVDVEEDEQDKIIIGRIIEIYDLVTFERDNREGCVRNIEIADDTGSIRVSLWHEDAKRQFELGQAIKLQNPRFSYNDTSNRIEASVSSATTILEPSESELEKLPSYEELMEAIFVQKPIEALLEDDTNVKITAQIIEVNTNRYMLRKCPNCGANVEQTDIENVCDYCGEQFDEPNYTLMIPVRLGDESGEISATFFDKLAEQLIDMDKESVISAIEDGYGIEDKLEDLTNLTIEIIANVTFDDYSEENKLNPKKILSKYF